MKSARYSQTCLWCVCTLHGRDLEAALRELNVLADFLHDLLAISDGLSGALLRRHLLIKYRNVTIYVHVHFTLHSC